VRERELVEREVSHSLKFGSGDDDDKLMYGFAVWKILEISGLGRRLGRGCSCREETRAPAPLGNPASKHTCRLPCALVAVRARNTWLST
jgi:hypothetical protein